MNLEDTLPIDTKRLLDMIASKGLEDAGYLTLTVAGSMRASPRKRHTIICIWIRPPAYHIYKLTPDSLGVSTTEIRDRILGFKVRDEDRLRLRAIVTEYIIEGISPGDSGYDMVWKWAIENATKQGLPLAFLVIGRFVSEGDESAELCFPIALNPDEVLELFQDYIRKLA